MVEKRRGRPSKIMAEAKRRNIGEEGLELLYLIENVKKMKGGTVAAPFLELPSRDDYPDYYEVIKRPISLEEIEIAVKNGEFADRAEFLNAFDIMVQNSVVYNGQRASITEDARTIRQYVEKEIGPLDADSVKSAVLAGESNTGLGSSSFREYSELLRSHEKKILDEMENLKAEDNKRRVADMFLEEPDKKLYPEYYQVIEKPTSISTIRRQIDEDRKARTIDGFVELVKLMFDNAKLFNDEASQVYEDAVTLEKLFSDRIAHLREVMQEPEGYNSWARISNHVLTTGTPDIDQEAGGRDESSFFDQGGDLELQNNNHNNGNYEHGSASPTPGSVSVRPSSSDGLRPAGKGAADALITSVSISSLIPTSNHQAHTPAQATPTNATNYFQMIFPASEVHTVNSHTFQLPMYHHTINIYAELSKTFHNRFYQMAVQHNTRKLYPVSSSANNPFKDVNQPMIERYELRLQPGLNRLEIICAAGPVQKSPVRHSTQQPLPIDGREEERFIFWIMLTKPLV